MTVAAAAKTRQKTAERPGPKKPGLFLCTDQETLYVTYMNAPYPSLTDECLPLVGKHVATLLTVQRSPVKAINTAIYLHGVLEKVQDVNLNPGAAQYIIRGSNGNAFVFFNQFVRKIVGGTIYFHPSCLLGRS